MLLVVIIAEVDLCVQSFRKTELAVVFGEHVLCLNEKPILRKEFYLDVWGREPKYLILLSLFLDLYLSIPFFALL